MNNNGIFKYGVYMKYISLSQELILPRKELSMSKSIREKIRDGQIRHVVYTDQSMGEKWTFTWEQIFLYSKLKLIGKEERYCFPLSIGKKTDVDKKVEWEIDRETNTAYVKGSRKPEQLSLL